MKRGDEDRVSELVAAWFAGDSVDRWYDAYTEEPESAWVAILEIIRHDLTEDQLAELAAGPLENLLVWHGPSFIDRVEKEANMSSRFNHLLGGVWRQEMPQEIWDRIVSVRKEVW